MVWDVVRGVTVLFGGYTGAFSAETWTWDGTNWTLRTPVNAPPGTSSPPASSSPPPSPSAITVDPMVALRRLYTPAEANKTLPLVRVIVRDVREVALRLRQTWSRVQAARPGSRERERLSDEMEDDRSRLAELSAELDRLGIELKDPLRGLIDFRALRGGVEVYLCWEFGEDRIDHWHPLDSGFAGRQPIDQF